MQLGQWEMSIRDESYEYVCKSDGDVKVWIIKVHFSTLSCVVNAPVSVVEPEVMTHHADKHVSQARGQVGQLTDVPRGAAAVPESVAEHSSGDAEDNLSRRNCQGLNIISKL